ncbi:unnamed protein product, partial [Porites evermanni]
HTLRGLDLSPLPGGPLVVMTPTDYKQTSLANFNILIPQSQSGTCHQFEFMNIRGHECFNCTAPLWYGKAENFLHTDSDTNICELNVKTFAVYSEDNFGSCVTVNPLHLC